MTKKIIIYSILLILATAVLGFYGYGRQYAPAAAGSGLLSSEPKPGIAALHDYEIVFRDEFVGDTLNTDRWVTCYDWYDSKLRGCTNSGNNELEWYMPEQVKVGGGHVTLTAKPQTMPGIDKEGKPHTYPYVSGMISTGRPDINSPAKWVNAYGYYEARMQVPAGKGLWPAFWMPPEAFEWPPEIDVMELLGDKPNEIITTYFWKKPDGKPGMDSSIQVNKNVDYTKDWHTYAINWQPGYLEWYIDGKSVKRVRSDKVSTKPLELIFNLAVGGRLPGNPDASTPFPAEMKVDYVRVYKDPKQK